MARSDFMPGTACEHINASAVKKVNAYRAASSTNMDPDFATYTCLTCPSFTSSFQGLDKHFTKTKHDSAFAVSSSTVYCGECHDLIYEPIMLIRTGKTVSAISSKPALCYTNGVKRKYQDTAEDDDSYLTANTSQRPCGRAGVRGLFNLGETCYMNAVLQMMVHNPLLASYFLGMGHPIHTCPISNDAENKKPRDDSEDEDDVDEDKKDKEQQTCVACGMTEVFSDVTMVDQPIPAHAVNLLFASWKNIPEMSGKGQQDAQEWFMCIVDRLHEGVATNANSNKQCTCFFHKVFYGRFNSQLTCDTCHNVSSQEDEFSTIPLDFKKQVKKRKKAAKEAALKEAAEKEAAQKERERNRDGDESIPTKKSKAVPPVDLKIQSPTLADMLRAFTAPEPLSPEQYNCTSCSTKRSAQKQTRVRKLPVVLSIHVKRFGMKSLSTGNIVPEKYEGRMEFPLILDMGDYTTRPPIRNGYTNGHSTTNGDDVSINKGQYVYDLDCVVVHQGEHAQNGHYFAFCRQDNKWFRFDDEIVSATTTEDVLRQEAYLLFYSQRRIERK